MLGIRLELYCLFYFTGVYIFDDGVYILDC